MWKWIKQAGPWTASIPNIHCPIKAFHSPSPCSSLFRINTVSGQLKSIESLRTAKKCPYVIIHKQNFWVSGCKLHPEGNINMFRDAFICLFHKWVSANCYSELQQLIRNTGSSPTGFVFLTYRCVTLRCDTIHNDTQEPMSILDICSVTCV